MKKITRNRYEKRILQTLDTMKIIYAATVFLNLFLPVIAPFSMGITSPFIWAVLIFHTWGLLNGLGYFNQDVPVVPVVLIRTAHTAITVYFKAFNWPVYLVVLLLDLIFILYLYNHKSKYEYIRVKNSELKSEGD